MGFSTITKNWYKGLKREQTRREVYLPGVSDEEYYRLGKQNSRQLLEYCKGKELDTVVDYGCGDGRVARYMARECNRIVMVDINEFTLRDAEQLFRKFKITNAEFRKAEDIKEEGFADLVYTFQVIQHCNDEEQLKMVSHIKSMLKQDGIGCIHMPKIEDKPFYRNGGMCMCFTREQVEHFGKMFSSYEIQELEFAPNWVDYYLWVKK